jgi:hypothetical protein
VSLGASKAFLRREKERSDQQVLTNRCADVCAEPCGICGHAVKIGNLPESDASDDSRIPASIPVPKPPRDGTFEASHRVVVSFSKVREGAWIPHLGLLEVWHKAFQRSGLPILFSEGFNPLPRFEIAQSMSLGVSSSDEIASFLLHEGVDEEEICRVLTESLPRNIVINRVFAFPLSRKLKREALSKYLWGNEYTYAFADGESASRILGDARVAEYVSATPGTILSVPDGASCAIRVPFAGDRPFRDLLAEIAGKPIYELVLIHKTRTLALNEAFSPEPVSFFDALIPVSRAHREMNPDAAQNSP